MPTTNTAALSVLQRSTFNLQREFTAWGRVGFALWADDYSQGVHNHYGIRHMQLLVDGREVFRSDVDSIPISCSQRSTNGAITTIGATRVFGI